MTRPFRDPIIYTGAPIRRHTPLFQLCRYCQVTYRRANRTQHNHHKQGECLLVADE